MAAGLRQQIEARLTREIVAERAPWKRKKNSHAWAKSIKHRRERRRAGGDPECPPEYRRYRGYEW